jgi:hypothetical protein
MPSIVGAPVDQVAPGVEAGKVEMKGGKRTRGASVKQLKKMLKKAGLKSTGKKAALTRRAKKAHLKLVKKGGQDAESTSGTVKMGDEKVEETSEGGRRRRSRRSRGFRLF